MAVLSIICELYQKNQLLLLKFKQNLGKIVDIVAGLHLSRFYDRISIKSALEQTSLGEA